MDDPSPDRPAGRLPVRSAAVIALYGLSLLMVNFGRPWVLTFHEVNYAEPAREFLTTGDWLVPRIAGKPLWDKPPLMHWAIAGSLAATGTEAEWAARLPSALAAAATALVVAALAARWHGGRVGLLAGLVQSTSVYVFMQGRLAEADMLLCAAVAAAFGCYAAGAVGRSPGERAPRRWAIGYFAAAGLAFLAKGPVGPALIAVGSGLHALIERRRAPWRLLLDPAGWGLMLAMIVAWPAAAMLREPGLLENWWQHNAERFGGGLTGGDRGPLFYLYTVPWMALPWTPMAVAGLVGGPRSGGRPGSAWRLLGCWLVAGLVLLSFSSWKHKHYIIPLLPPLSIWAAVGLERLAYRRPRPVGPGRWRSPALVIAGVVAAAIGALVGLGTLTAVGAAAVAVGASLMAAQVLRRAGRPGPALGAIFAGAWAAFVAVQSLAMPGFDLYRPRAELARRLARSLPEGAGLAVVGIPDPQVLYYLPLPVVRIDRPDRADPLPALPAGPLYVVGPAGAFDLLATTPLAVRTIDRASAIHPGDDERDRLVAAVIEPRDAVAVAPPPAPVRR